MKRIKLNNDISLSAVVAGCMRTKDSQLEGDKLLEFVELCLELGVTSYDHAPVYGCYTCEEIFGDAVLKVKPSLRERMEIITKTGIVLPGVEGNKTIYYKSTKEQIEKEVDESLRKLNTDYIDVLLIHRPDPLAHPQETAEALESVIKSKKVLSVGVSNFMPSQIQMLQSYLNVPIVTNQMELSVKTVDNFFNGVTDDALTRRMPLMSWSPLGGGSVFVGEDEQSLRLRRVLGAIAETHNVTIDTIMYAWLFAQPVEIAAVTGTMKIERMKKAIEGLNIELSYDEWYQILAASRGYDVP